MNGIKSPSVSVPLLVEFEYISDEGVLLQQSKT